LAATTKDEVARNQVYNVAVNGRTSLNTLFDALKNALGDNAVNYTKNAIYRDFRAGDVRHSQADIGKAEKLLGYDPKYGIRDGVAVAMPWYIGFLKESVTQ